MMSSWMRAKVWRSSRAAPASTTIRSVGVAAGADERPVAERRPEPLAPGQHQLPEGLEGLDQLGVDRRPAGQLLVEDDPDPVLDPGRDRAQAGRCVGRAGDDLHQPAPTADVTGGRSGGPERPSARRSKRAAMAKPMAAPTPSTRRPPAASSTEVVGGDDDGEQGEGGIDDGQGLGPPRLEGRHQHQRAPRGPGEVEAGHGRVLVGDLAHGARVERPQAAVDPQGVDEPVRRGEQPGRHQRVGGEADQGQGGGGGEGVAPAPVAGGEASEQEDQGEDGDEEVEGAVEQVPELDEAVPRQEALLDGLLVVRARAPSPSRSPAGRCAGPGPPTPPPSPGCSGRRCRRRRRRGSAPPPSTSAGPAGPLPPRRRIAGGRSSGAGSWVSGSTPALTPPLGAGAGRPLRTPVRRGG